MDMDPSCIVLETPLARLAVRYDKGCYPGQEVVARLRAYGAPKQALMGLVMARANTPFPAPGSVLLADGKKVGRLCGSPYSPPWTEPLLWHFWTEAIVLPACASNSPLRAIQRPSLRV